MAEDGKQKKKTRKLGGLKTMPFILANDFCDRFAATGFHANMITYLTQELHLPLVKASNTLTNFAGTASLTPLVGALIADSFAGRFWTITVGLIIYQLGMISLTISAILPSLRPEHCDPNQLCKEASSLQLWVLYISLFLTSIGSGGIRPCVVAFGADQFDMTKPGKAGRKFNFFNWYYFSMGIATLVALTVVVYIQDNVGWGWGLGLPTTTMGISVVAFLLGYPLYQKVKPAGSPLTRLAQVIVAAVKKRSVNRPEDPDLLYENRELDAAISSAGRLVHSNQLKFFDRAAIIRPGDEPEPGQPRLWRLSTVHRVEELKSIIRMIPIWSVGILTTAAGSHQSSFSVLQARTMDRHFINSFQIPPASMTIFAVLTMLLGILLYDSIFIPFISRFTKNPSGITYLQRMGIGLMINVTATVSAALVEVKRKRVATAHGLIDQPQAVIPISVFWLVPQYAIHGMAEAFTSVGHLEFLYDQSPESMRSTAAALFWLSASMGNYLSTLIVSLVHKYTGKESNWVPDRNINKGRLECYFWLVTGLQLLNLVYYVVCAWFYTYKPLEVLGPESPMKGDDVGANGHVELAKSSTVKDAMRSSKNGSTEGGRSKDNLDVEERHLEHV